MVINIVRRKSDLVNTKESILPVCDKPYHTNNRILQKWEELEKLRNYALVPKNTENSGEVKGDMSDLLISYLSAIY